MLLIESLNAYNQTKHLLNCLGETTVALLPRGKIAKNNENNPLEQRQRPHNRNLVTAPKRRQVQLVDETSSEVLSTVTLETPEDAVHMASLIDDLTACTFSYGVPSTAGTEHEAIEKGRKLLDEWRAAVESEQGGVEKVCEATALNPKTIQKQGRCGSFWQNFSHGHRRLLVCSRKLLIMWSEKMLVFNLT